MTIPSVTRFDDFRFGLYDLSAATQAILSPDSVIDPQFETVPGVGGDRLKNCTFNIPWYEDARESFDFDHLQLLAMDRYSDADLTLWGVVLKPKEGYSSRVARDSIQVQTVQVEELLKARKVFEYVDGANAAIQFVNQYPDDIAKELVRRCFAGTDVDGNSRAWEWGTLNVEADSSQCASPINLTVLSGPEPEDTLFKHLDELARTYDFDFQLKVSRSGGAWTFTFCTQAPYGGDDLTTGDDRVTIKDIYNLVPAASRYRDAAFRATRMYTAGYRESVEDATAITDWGLWEGAAESAQLSDAEIALEKARVKKGAEYGFEATGANGMVLWLRDFKAGDLVNRVNNRLGIEADSEKIAAVIGRFQNKVLQLTIRWGDREPASTDRQSGGAYNSADGGSGQVLKDPLPVGNTADPGSDETHRVLGDHIHDLNIMADDGNAMTLNDGVGEIIGAGGVETLIVGGKLVIDGASVTPAHAITGALHTVTGAQYDLVGLTATNTLGLLTPTVVGAANSVVRTDASGQITAVAFLLDANNYLDEPAGNRVRLNGNNFVDLAVAGTTQLRLQGGILFPIVTNTVDVGTTRYRLKGLYSVEGNFSGDVTIGTADKGLVFNSNTSGKLLVGNGSRYVPKTPSLTGHTAGWTTVGSVDYNGNPLRRASDGAVLYLQPDGTLATGSGTSIGIGATEHYHDLTGSSSNMGGTTGNAGITFA